MRIHEERPERVTPTLARQGTAHTTAVPIELAGFTISRNVLLLTRCETKCTLYLRAQLLS